MSEENVYMDVWSNADAKHSKEREGIFNDLFSFFVYLPKEND